MERVVMTEADLRHIRIADLDRRHNVRRSLGDLSDLVESIRDFGVLTPVTVTPKASSSGWRLVAGHRRTAAAEEAGLETVPALVHTAEGADERLLATLVENLQRLDLDPVEEAGGYRSLVDAGWSQAEVARRVRRSRGHVSRRLRILTLPDEVQEMVAEGTVTVEHAYTLSRLVAKGVDAEVVSAAADTAPEYAATRLLEIETAERREHRRRKLERGGVKVVLADRRYHAHEKYDRLLSSMRLDGDHSAEPCHVVILHYNDYGRTTIGEDAACTDRSRHDADGDSELKVRSARPETDEERRKREERDAEHEARQKERRAAEAAQLRRLTAQLRTLPDEVAIAAVLRREARDVLRRVRTDDPLLPVGEGVVDPDESWMYPAQVIDSAQLGDLARAVLRWWLIQTEKGSYHNKRTMRPVYEVAEALPELPDEDDPEKAAAVA